MGSFVIKHDKSISIAIKNISNKIIKYTSSKGIIFHKKK